MISTSSAIKNYDALRSMLQQEAPDQWQAILTLCNAVPRDITTETLWLQGRDKPCYANMRSEVMEGSNKLSQGQLMAQSLQSCPDMAKAGVIASLAWNITDHRIQHFVSNKNYSADGAAVQYFLAGQGKIFSKYLWRLNAVRGLALALNDLSVLDIVQAIQKTSSITAFNQNVHQLQHLLASYTKGWGPISILHWLTDLGLAVKPDVHLKTSAVQLGLISEKDKDKNLLVMHAVREFSQQVQGDSAHHYRSTLREVDKVLMESSRLRLWSKI